MRLIDKLTGYHPLVTMQPAAGYDCSPRCSTVRLRMTTMLQPDVLRRRRRDARLERLARPTPGA
jgi:hypothetical protein